MHSLILSPNTLLLVAMVAVSFSMLPESSLNLAAWVVLMYLRSNIHRTRAGAASM